MSDKKKNVDIDELMQSLKRGNSAEPSLQPHPEEGSGAEGRLVTRADGSKAIKVKSRKRRSHQPKKEKERKSVRNKVIMVTASIVLCLMAGIAFTVLLAYYNGTKFSEKLVSTLKNDSGAEVKVNNLEVSLGNATMHSMSYDWESPNSTIDYVNFSGIVADYGVFSFFKGGWSGSEVLADKGEVQLHLQDQPAQIKTGGDASVDFDFATYKCRSLNVTLGKDTDWEVLNTQAEFSVNEKGGKQVYLYGGEMRTPFFEEYKIRSGVVEVNSDYSDMSLILLTNDGRGSVNLAGKVGYKKGANVVLKTKFTNVELDGWMDDKVKRFLNGKISKGEGTLKMALGDTANKEVLTHAELDDVGLTNNFEFVQTLGMNMKDDYYARPTFQSGSKMTIDWKKDRTIVKNIRLVEEEDFIVTGSFSVNHAGALSGKLRLGIPIGKLDASELLRLKKVFKEEVDEVIWTDVTLSGSVAIPKDDLANQFELAKGIETESEDSSEKLFENLNTELGQ